MISTVELEEVGLVPFGTTAKVDAEVKRLGRKITAREFMSLVESIRKEQPTSPFVQALIRELNDGVGLVPTAERTRLTLLAEKITRWFQRYVDAELRHASIREWEEMGMSPRLSKSTAERTLARNKVNRILAHITKRKAP